MGIFEDRPGINYIAINDWRKFILFIDKIKNKYQYIWRGQSDSSWDLESSFDRLLRKEKYTGNLEYAYEDHLDRFKYIARGRIEYDEICDKYDNEMWALAQHYGLATPLLDWTFSPFVALFFAIHNHLNEEKQIAIWGLGNIDDLNKIAHKEGIPRIRRFIPQQKNNPRLMSQNALFTRIPLGYTVNKWVEDLVEENSRRLFLYKIDIQFYPDDIKECLILLNRMNINYYTLFPDADGVTKFCNMAFKIQKYHRFW